MYVIRPLSLLRRYPELVSMAPQVQEGPNSGYLVIFDEECETTTCFGLCKDRSIRDLPFPQNKDLTVRYSTGVGENRRTYHDDVVFIPAINQPLSSNRYYVIRRHGKHKGEAVVSSMEEDMGTFCCFTYIRDAKPRPLDPSDIYQQVEIIQKKHRGFTAASLAPDGFPPLFLRRKYWRLSMKSPRHYQLDEALGLDTSLRARLPGLDFSPRSSSSGTVVVGKWYVPFVFVKEDFRDLKEQMKRSMFYEMTLEQRWDKIFGCESGGRDGGVAVETEVEREEAFVDEKEVVCDWGFEDNGVTWFKSAKGGKGEESRVLGLSALVVERMRWEQERVGFRVDEFERKVKVKRNEEFEGKCHEWKYFGCYVLVERFVLKRMDGSVLLTHNFKHTSQIRCKWE